jgi:[ribosomal protein S18]-alanine N-acetyltransferase
MIRPFEMRDKQTLLKILELNIPRYFDESEVSDLREYLDRYREDYFVIEDKGRVIGAGGINYFPEENIARLSWDYVHPDYHGKGAGRKLVEYRLEILRGKPAVQRVVVRTTQLVYPFYEKMGFTLDLTEKDYWAPGFDLYQMSMELR